MAKSKSLPEANLDFEAINKRLMNERPKKLSKMETLHKLHKGLSKALDNGMSYEQLVDILHDDYNISVAVSSLRKAMALGKLSGHIDSNNARDAADDLNKE